MDKSKAWSAFLPIDQVLFTSTPKYGHDCLELTILKITGKISLVDDKELNNILLFP